MSETKSAHRTRIGAMTAGVADGIIGIIRRTFLATVIMLQGLYVEYEANGVMSVPRIFSRRK